MSNTKARPESTRTDERGETGRSANPLSWLRMVGYAVVWTALAFAQATGKIVADTKFDLVADPTRFLAGATRLWDSGAAFGQVQNQAYGYLWPMGPFFWVGDLVAVPDWILQRLWWALLLNLAFFGMLRLLRDLRIGGPRSQVAAAATFVLAPRVTSILGETSVELWPTALAPWILITLVRCRRDRPVLRSAALAALLVACCGGVNATAVSAVIPAGVIWLLTRERGWHKWRLLVAWGGLTVLATSWWLVPLLYQGTYSAPFLDYIENAALTSAVTDLGSSLLGVSNWTVYAGAGYPAGSTIVSTPFILLDAAAFAAIGILGLASRGLVHRRFAVLTLLTGLVLVGLGWAGEVHGWWALSRQASLDGALAALRNTHKYDVLIRMALAIGFAHAVSRPIPEAWSRDSLRIGGLDLPVLARRVTTAVVVAALVGLAFPWIRGQVPAPGAFEKVPDYWSEVADYVGDQRGTALVVPAASFGDYTWGSTHDDVLQPYAEGAWAVRNVVPLAQPGNVRLLDQITEELESGRGSARLVDLLAGAGVGTLVVRNDLSRFTTGAPDPAYLHAALDSSPGLRRTKGFGPLVGERRSFLADDGTRVFSDRGLAGRYRAVEVYQVANEGPGAVRLPADVTVMGDPGSGAVLTPDAPEAGRVILTDGLRRQETAFQAVRGNLAATSAADSVPAGYGKEQFHRLFPDQERWQTTLDWEGADYVSASTSRAEKGASTLLVPGDQAASAVDDDPQTAWWTPASSQPAGAWLELGLSEPADVNEVSVAIPVGAEPVSGLRVSAGAVTRTVAAPAPGERVTVRLDAEDVRRVRVAAVGPSAETGSWGISELTVPGVSVTRRLLLPTPPAGSEVNEIRMARDLGRERCPSVAGTITCLGFESGTGEDGDRIARVVELPRTAEYEVAATGSLRRSPALGDQLAQAAGAQLTTTGSFARDVAESSAAMVDEDPGTTWHASLGAKIKVEFEARIAVHAVALKLDDGAPFSAPTKVKVRAGKRSMTGALVDGRLQLPQVVRTKQLEITILAASAAFTTSGTQEDVLDPGVTELRVNAKRLSDDEVHIGCARGPALDLAGRTVRSRASGDLGELLRGGTVRLEPCAEPTAKSGKPGKGEKAKAAAAKAAKEAAEKAGRVSLGTAPSSLGVTPSTMLRGETMTLTAVDPTRTSPTQTGDQAQEPLALERDSHGAPMAAQIGVRPHDTVLAVPQNFNQGWAATVNGNLLTPQRVDGWQQGWRVPAGVGGQVRFSYQPEPGYRWGLVLGGLALLSVVTLAVVLQFRHVRARRSSAVETPSLEPQPEGRVGPVDAAVVVLALGLLAGWPGVVAGVGFALVRRVSRRTPWGLLAGAALMLSALPKIVPDLTEWGATSQWSALLAVAVVAGSVLSLADGLGFSRRNGPSRNRRERVAATSETDRVTASTSVK